MTAASLTAARSFVATPVRPIGSVEGQRAFAFRHAGKRFGD
ncbi:ABC transporter ATP-binding protein, partial [Mesorhizobium sp. M7A.F.Ca.AU.001.01.1.1]